MTLFITDQEAWAKRPPEIRNQDDLNITQDMHGQDLSGFEFVKFNLKGIDFSQSDLTGAVFNNSQLNRADFHGAHAAFSPNSLDRIPNFMDRVPISLISRRILWTPCCFQPECHGPRADPIGFPLNFLCIQLVSY